VTVGVHNLYSGEQALHYYYNNLLITAWLPHTSEALWVSDKEHAYLWLAVAEW
jgi:hypothetical protein